MRYFEIRTKNGGVGVLSEKEIELYREQIDEVTTEFTPAEIEKLGFTPILDDETKSVLGLK